MPGPRRWLHALGFGKPRPDESAELEVEHHLGELTDRLVDEGWSPEDARAEAERRFGNARRYGARMRKDEEALLRMSSWAAAWEILRRSVVSAGRTARREPGFTLAVVLTLGLGIGANATMYGIIDRLLLSPPAHVVEPERVVRVLVDQPVSLFGLNMPIHPYLAYPDYVDWQSHTGFDGVAVFNVGGWDVTNADESVSSVRVQQVSPGMFPLLGADAHLGRFFGTEDIRPEATPTAVLSFEYWRSAYGADPAVLGRSIRIEGRLEYTIVGVAPRHFTGPILTPTDLWVPLELPLTGCITDRRCSSYQVVARLEDGVTVEAAEAEAEALHLAGRAVMIEDGSYSPETRIVLASLIAARGPDSTGEGRVAAWLAAVALIVLLVGCANVASLLLARSTRHGRETEVRLALGAGRGALIGQAMLETLVLASVGGVLALALARWGGRLIRSALLPDIYFPNSTLTPRLFAFTIVATVVAAVLAGCLPAVRARQAAARGLGVRSQGLADPRSRLRTALTVAQAAMAVVLLVGAGLFARSLDQLHALDLGLDIDELVGVQLGFPPGTDRLRQREIYIEVEQRIASLPSVASVATTSAGLGSNMTVPLRVRGIDSIPRLPGGGPYLYTVPRAYFDAVGLGVVRGEIFTSADVAGSERVVVVSETMARTLWPDSDAVGQCLLRGARGEECMRVVAVVEDAARNGYLDEPFMAYYMPLEQSPQTIPNMIYVRAGTTVDAVVRDVTALLDDFSGIRRTLVLGLRERLDPQARSWNLGATMFTAFGLLALIVAAVGLYSLLAFDVAQRTREIGIRMALGARHSRVLRSVASRGVLAGGIGVAAGLAIAYVAAPFLQDLLFETSPRDARVFGTAALVLLGVSTLASIGPALRATRVDPMVALKSD